jgi:hypothetical protein
MIRFDFDVVSDPQPVQPPPRPAGRDGTASGTEDPSPQRLPEKVEPGPSAPD